MAKFSKKKEEWLAEEFPCYPEFPKAKRETVLLRLLSTTPDPDNPDQTILDRMGQKLAVQDNCYDRIYEITNRMDLWSGFPTRNGRDLNRDDVAKFMSEYKRIRINDGSRSYRKHSYHQPLRRRA